MYPDYDTAYHQRLIAELGHAAHVERVEAEKAQDEWEAAFATTRLTAAEVAAEEQASREATELAERRIGHEQYCMERAWEAAEEQRAAHPSPAYADLLKPLRNRPGWGELAEYCWWGDAPALRHCDRDEMLRCCREVPFVDICRRAHGDQCAAALIQWAAAEVVEEMLDACPDAYLGVVDAFWAGPERDAA